MGSKAEIIFTNFLSISFVQDSLWLSYDMLQIPLALSSQCAVAIGNILFWFGIKWLALYYCIFCVLRGIGWVWAWIEFFIKDSIVPNFLGFGWVWCWMGGCFPLRDENM